MMQGRLVSGILKNATTVEVEPIGAYDNFTLTGGDAYIGTDKFIYTGITLGTTSFTLTGCAGIDFSHDAEVNISSHFGVRFIDIAPAPLKTLKNDPDGLADTIFKVLESGMFKVIKDGLIDVHRNVDPTRADLLFLKYICSNNGLESNEDVDEDTLRSLARQATAVLSLRGTENAFKFMAWHTLGYELDIQIDRAKVNSIWNNRNFRWYMPPTEMGIDSKTVGYWKFKEGSGLSSLNEIVGGSDFKLVNATQWSTDSMFRKSLSIEISAAHTYIEATATATKLSNLHGKRSWALRWMMKPATGGALPQTVLYKGTMLVVTRPNATDLAVAMSDGLTTVTYTFTACIVENRWNYISLIFNRPTMALVVDSNIIDSTILFDLDTVDMGDKWIFGDKTGAQEYLGKIDTFMVSTGVMYLAEAVHYFEHLDVLRSYATATDMNTYVYDLGENNNRVDITILNSDGDSSKLDFLEYLVTEWLTISNYTINNLAHLPLEMELGWFKHERIVE
jgi:hypothetical protein